MPRLRFVSLSMVAALAGVVAFPALSQVTVTNAWVRALAAGQKTSGAYMQIKSATDATLVDVTTPAAKIAEIHSMKMEGGTMTMNALERVPLPAGKVVEFKAGGTHVMLMDVAPSLKEGSTVPITLTIEDKSGKKSTVVVTAQVKGASAADVPAAAR